MGYEKAIAKAGLEIKAIKINPDNPFTWASGFRMPIYNDNRRFLFMPEHRDLITTAFNSLLYDVEDGFNFKNNVIAGTKTAGIPWGVLLAHNLSMSFVYVGEKPKGHGLRHQIEGIDSEDNLEGRRVILIEDLISTGETAAGLVQALRDRKGVCNDCLSIFDYGFEKAKEEFRRLNPECIKRSLLDYGTLMDFAKERGYVTVAQVKMLDEWRSDPFGWGEKHGFPRVER